MNPTHISHAHMHMHTCRASPTPQWGFHACLDLDFRLEALVYGV
jgi:hypothetical protein